VEEKKFTKDEFSFAEVLAIVGGRTRNTLIVLYAMNLYKANWLKQQGF
jgi:hypothetical protein